LNTPRERAKVAWQEQLQKFLHNLLPKELAVLGWKENAFRLEWRTWKKVAGEEGYLVVVL